jgi:hypothetical protein
MRTFPELTLRASRHPARRWRHAAILVAVASLGLAAGMAAAHAAPVDTLCGADPSRVAAEIAKRRLGPSIENARLLAVNDVTCGGTGEDGVVAVHMANLTVAATVRGQQLYLIGHVHFFAAPGAGVAEPRIASVAAMMRWTPLEAEEWRERWCAFLASVYAGEASAQSCPPK